MTRYWSTRRKDALECYCSCSPDHVRNVHLRAAGYFAALEAWSARYGNAAPVARPSQKGL